MSTTAAAMRSNFDAGDRLWFKIGAVSFILGIVLLLVTNILHPHQAASNDNPAAFAEYAADTRWLGTHLMQLFGTLLFTVIGVLAIYRSLENQASGIKGLARFALVMALIQAAVYTVDMGIDGVALKRAVDAWAGAAPGDKNAYFAVAEGIRWLEYGVLGFAGEFQGIVVLLLSSGMVMSAVYPKWMGWLGVIGGAAFVIGGFAVVSGGFSPVQQIVTQIGFLFVLAWAFVVAVRLWRL